MNPALHPLVAPLSDASPPARGSWTDTLGLALLMAGAFCCPTNWSVVEGYLAVGDAFFIAALLVQARSAARRVVELGGIPWGLLLCGLLFAMSGLVNFARDLPQADPVTAAKLVFSLALFPLLLMLSVGAELRRLQWVFVAWMAGGVLSAIVAIAGSRGISVFGFFDETAAAGGRAQGLAYHANALGYTSALIAPVAAYLACRAPGSVTRWLALFCLGLLLYALHLSGSRASLLALGVGLAVPLLALLPRHGVATVIAGMGLVSLALLVGAAMIETNALSADRLANSAVGRLLGFSSTDVSNAERRLYMGMAWERVQAYPLLGEGYGWLRGAHVHVLAILHSGGLLGLSGLLVWATTVCAAGVRLVGALRDPALASYRALWPVVLSGLLVWLVNGGLQPVLPDRNGYILVGVLFLLAGHARHVVAPRSAPP